MKITKRNKNVMELKEKSFFSKLIAILLVVTSVTIIIKDEFAFDSIYVILILLAVAAFIFLTAKTVHVIIDKPNNIIDINKESLLNKRRKRIEISNLDHVNVKEIRKTKYYDDNTKEVNYSYNILLVLKDNSTILLNHQSSSRRFFFIKLKSKDQKTGEKIAAFLNIPYKKTSK